MMSNKKGSCFISCPKTGTHTIYHMLKEDGWKRVGAYHQRPKPQFLHLYEHRYGAARNPYDRAISIWSSFFVRGQYGHPLGYEGKEFPSFVEMLRSIKAGVLTDLKYMPVCDWYRGLRLTGCYFTEGLPTGIRKNTSDDSLKEHPPVITAECGELVRDIYHEDFEIGYSLVPTEHWKQWEFK